MKVLVLVLAIVCPFSSYASQPSLSVYTYDSLVSPEGLAPKLTERFQKNCSCTLKWVGVGDTGQLLSRISLDSRRGKYGAQVLVGLERSSWERAQPWVEDLKGWSPSVRRLAPHVRVEKNFVPFDYGVFAWMGHEPALPGLNRLEDLLKPEFKRKFILEDPRTSAPGLAFLLFTKQVLKNNFAGYWTKLRGQWLALVPSWDAAYSLFLKGEAPWVWSYASSQAYHQEHGEKGFRAFPLEEGEPIQVEGAAIIKNALNSPEQRDLARKFLEFLVSKEVQELVPKTNWMLPVRTDVPVPESFKKLPHAKTRIDLPTHPNAIEATLYEWQRAISEP